MEDIEKFEWFPGCSVRPAMRSAVLEKGLHQIKLDAVFNSKRKNNSQLYNLF